MELKKLLAENPCQCGACDKQAKPGNKFYHGHNRKNRPCSEEHKRKVGNANRGKPSQYKGKTKFPLLEKICGCPDKEPFITRNPKRQFVNGHNNKGNLASQESKNKMSLATRGKPKSLEHRRSLSKAHQGEVHSEQSKEKARENWLNGKYDHLTFNEGRGKPVFYNGIWMRSMFESRCAILLDTQNIKWIYEPKRFKLPNTTYMPDFYLPEFDIWLECKWTNDYEEYPELYKVDLLRQEGKFVTIVTEKEIYKLEKGLV